MMLKTLLLATALVLCAGPALAAPKPAASAEPDEKLPAQLPSVTIQGQDVVNQGVAGTKLVPSNQGAGSHVRLPDPIQRRATSENNRSLMVNVTPSTLEQAGDLPGTRLPYTSILGGYGPLTQYRLDLYDARLWGPVLGITNLAGRAGWNWSGWSAREDLGLAQYGRLGLAANGYAWDRVGNTGNQLFYGGSYDYEHEKLWGAGVDFDRGLATTKQGAASLPDLLTQTARVRARLSPDFGAEHQPDVQLTAQHRIWGVQSGAEGYLNVADFWSLNDQVQLQGGLGGGYWGREAILDPMVAFHYRPAPSTHLYASLKTASELPDFSSLYLERAASAPNTDLSSERVEGWAGLGGSQRLSDAIWANLDLGLRRSFRHIYWADPAGTGLWAPQNAAGEQWSPTGALRVQYQWGDTGSVELGYRGDTVSPLGISEHLGSLSYLQAFLDRKLDVEAGVEGRFTSLSALQRPGGGSASGVFVKARAAYKLTPDWSLGLHVADVPVVLDAIGTTYYAPSPWITFDVQYQF